METGLSQSVIEFIDNISFGEINDFSSNEHLKNNINNTFRINTDTNENTRFNQYCILADFFSGSKTTLPKQKDREKKRTMLCKYMKGNVRATYRNYRTDTLTFNLSEQFYTEYENLPEDNKALVCEMLLTKSIQMYTEYIKSLKTKETTFSFVLHADEEDKGFHVHRLFGYAKLPR